MVRSFAEPSRCIGAGENLDLGNICAGGKSAVAGAGDDRNALGCIIVKCAERRVDLGDRKSVV